jgi:large subunit ribosomal protein L25
MSQSLRAIKGFRIRELTFAASPKNSRIPSAATAASNLHSPEGCSPPSRSGTGTLNPFVPHKNTESGRWAPPRYSLRRQADLIKHARASGTLHLLPPGPKMNSAQLLAAAAAATTSSCSVFGNAHVEENAVVGSGLVSLRRGKKVRGPEEGQKLRPANWQEAAVAEAVVVEGEARGDVPAPGQDALVTQGEWTRPVEWVGTVRERNVAGADVGNRLYAGKKRMFKGHKWERVRERRVARTNILLRDMDKRIQRFKGVRYYFSSSLLPPLPLPPLLSHLLVFLC